MNKINPKYFSRVDVSRQGLTLIEVVIAMAIMALLLVGISRMGGLLNSLGTLAGDSLQTEQGLRQALDTFTLDVRGMGQSSLGGYPMESASTSSFIFYSDVDRDGLYERVRYSFSTSTLSRGIIKPTGNPLTYATSSEIVSVAVPSLVGSGNSLDYFDAAYTGTSTPMTMPVDVTTIRVARLRVRSDLNIKSAPKSMSLEAVVTIRNLRSN